MNDTQEVSVIIPVYNVEKFLARCLDSALAQTFKNFEIICVNDGSPDGSAAVLENYAAKDPRVKIITQSNAGLSAARNAGLKNSAGTFIYFLDSDDFIHPRLLEICLYFLKKYNADMVRFNYDKAVHKASKKTADFKFTPPVYEHIENIAAKITDNPLKFFKKNFSYNMTYYAWAGVYRKDLLKDIEFVPGILFEDDPFITAVCAKRPKTVLLSEPLYYYVDNPRSIANKAKAEMPPKHIEDYHKGILYMREKFKNAPAEDLDFLAKVIIYRRLRIQFKKIRRAEKSKRPELYKVFTKELSDLDSKGLLRLPFTPRGLFYRAEIKKLLNSYQ